MGAAGGVAAPRVVVRCGLRSGCAGCTEVRILADSAPRAWWVVVGRWCVRAGTPGIHTWSGAGGGCVVGAGRGPPSSGRRSQATVPLPALLAQEAGRGGGAAPRPARPPGRTTRSRPVALTPRRRGCSSSNLWWLVTTPAASW